MALTSSELGFVFATTYGAVFVAEILGDKLLYTAGVLGTRFPPAPVICGMALAFAVKMAVAVVIGNWIASLPTWLMAAAAATTFGGLALALFRTPEGPRNVPARAGNPGRAGLVSFAVVLFSEWGDPGQLTTAVLSTRFEAPVVVWLGSLCAVMTKGAVVACLGARVRRLTHDRVPANALRYFSAAAIVLIGIASVIEIMSLSR